MFAFVAGIALFYAPHLRAVPFIRDLYYQKKFEGLWVSAVEIGERPYALASIYFDNRRRTWIYRGTAFSRDLLPSARWKSFSVTFAQGNRWFFYGGASRLVARDGEHYRQLHPPGRVISVLSLQDYGTAEFEGLVTDLGVDGQNPISFRVYLKRAKPIILEDVFEGKATPHIEDITYKQAARILDMHLKGGHLPEKYDDTPVSVDP